VSSSSSRPPGCSVEIVIDVDRQVRVRSGIVERITQEDLSDRLRGRLDTPRASEIFAEALEGHHV